MIIERHNVVAQKAVMPKKMPKHKKIVVEDDIQVHLGELIYAWKKVRLKSSLGTNPLYNIFVFIVKIDSRWRRGGKIGVKWMVLFFWPWSDRIPRVEWHLLPNITAVNKLLWECPKKGVCKLKIALLPTFQLFIFCRWMLKTITKVAGTFFHKNMYWFFDNFC